LRSGATVELAVRQMAWVGRATAVAQSRASTLRTPVCAQGLYDVFSEFRRRLLRLQDSLEGGEARLERSRRSKPLPGLFRSTAFLKLDPGDLTKKFEPGCDRKEWDKSFVRVADAHQRYRPLTDEQFTIQFLCFVVKQMQQKLSALEGRKDN